MTTVIADRFAEGMSLARKADYDRAHRLLAECVIADPANYDYVDGLLLNLVRKMRLHGTPSEPVAKLRSAMLDAVEDKDWKEVLRLGPQSLAYNPWHKPTLLALLQACADQGFEDAELRYLQMAFESGPSDVEINRLYTAADWQGPTAGGGGPTGSSAPNARDAELQSPDPRRR